MNRGLLASLDKAEKNPYTGWKTNVDVQNDSPENDEVCLLVDGSCNDSGKQDSPKSTKCLSDGNKSPRDFKATGNSYRIPKKTNSPDNKATHGGSWIDSSFSETDHSPPRNCRTRSCTPRVTHKNEIGYRVIRQGQMPSTTIKRNWKYAVNRPGMSAGLRETTSKSQQEKMLSCQVVDADISERCNGSISVNSTKLSAQRTCNSLDEEQEHNRSVLDSIMEGKPVEIACNKALNKGENLKTDATNSNTNFRTKGRIPQQHDTLPSSKDSSTNYNFEDLFEDHCETCTTRLSQDKKCPTCNKARFPSQAATPRKHLSPERFYSSSSQKTKVQRTYSKRNSSGTPVLITGSVSNSTGAKEYVGSSQTNSRIKKRKKQGKSNSDDSDPEYTTGKKKQNGKQLKLVAPKTVDVITLSDEEEIEEATTELTVEEDSQSEANGSATCSDSITVVPESPSSSKDSKEGTLECDSTEVTSGKRKTSPSEEEHQPKKKLVDSHHGYTRDDLEIEIMIGQDVRIGTLACTAAEPLKITCRTDEIKLSVDHDNKNVVLNILGKDLASFKISHGQNPDVIVLGVTPGFALKLAHRFPNVKGKFINPGSAVASERDIVLEVNEQFKKEVIADLMDWVTDKLSKEFAQLNITDVKRIMSCKASASTTKDKNESPSEATSTSMTTRSRSYNTRTSSSRQPPKAAERLIVYPPPPQPGGITVTSEDIPCLAPGEFLNDVIIDFYLKFLFFEKLKPEDRNRTHILSSFFYKRLTQKNTNTSDTFTSTPDRMHSQVRTWTKNVDIFDKDFVFLPINESSHWYLAVICFAGHTDATYINEIPDEDDETKIEQQNKDSDPDTTNDDDDDYDDDDDDSELTSLAKYQSKSVKPKTRKKSSSKQIITSQPCILVFDSLGGCRNRCMVNLRNYLACEWRERKKDAEPRDFNKDNMKGNHPKVPQQDNFCDCGVYVLQYMESFFEDPITDFSFPIRKPEWFSFERITQKRNDIRKLIFNLKQHSESGDS